MILNTLSRLRITLSFRFVAILSVVVLLSRGATAEDRDPPRPNVLLIVADDVGWADVGYHGSPIPTPNLDRLAREGVELDRHYVAPMCTPTRAALLTGRYWSRFGNSSPSNEQVLPFGTVTLASALRSVGYRTCITGKWHLGSKPAWGPRKFGFDYSHGSLAGGVNPINHLYKHGPYSRTWHRNDALIEEEGHVTDLITREAVRFIEGSGGRPFFVYVPYTAAHTPFDEPDKYLELCAKIPPERRQYAACLAHLVVGVGEVVMALERTGARDRTLVVFFSDNGGTNGSDASKYPHTKPKGRVFGFNTPLRGWKKESYEGGIRTPALVSWPGHLAKRKVTAPLHVIDWMPTIAKLGGYEPKLDLNWDGRDIWPVLTGAHAGDEERVLYCVGPRGRAVAVHRGRWKLLRDHRRKTTELFDIHADPNETKNLADSEPEVVRALLDVMEAERRRDNTSLPRRGAGGPVR